MPTINITDEEFHTIIAALRLYWGSGQGDPNFRSDEIHNLATNGEACVSLDEDEIDGLIEDLNTGERDAPDYTALLEAVSGLQGACTGLEGLLDADFYALEPWTAEIKAWYDARARLAVETSKILVPNAWKDDGENIVTIETDEEPSVCPVDGGELIFSPQALDFPEDEGYAGERVCKKCGQVLFVTTTVTGYTYTPGEKHAAWPNIEGIEDEEDV